MNILILDDDIDFLKRIEDDVSYYFKDMKKDLHFIKNEFSLENLSSKNIHIAFIDINLGPYNGIEIAKYLTEKNNQIITIFISSNQNLVFQALITSVFQFIRKSNYDEDIQIVLKQLKDYIEKKTSKKIISIEGRPILINVNEIKYILSIGKDIYIYENNEYAIKDSLSNILNQLDSPDLVQIQRGLAVNLQFVKRFDKYHIITNDETTYQIGRKYLSEFITKYKSFLLK